jgi:hypothetical protein
MRRCAHCGGQLGLVVHRRFTLRFCRLACKKAHEKLADEERRAKQKWHAFLARGSPS